MTYSQTLREQLFETFDDLDSAYDKADSAVKIAIEALPFWVPGWVKGEAKDKWADLHAQGVEYLGIWKTNAEDAGISYDLSEAAGRWRTLVSATVSNQPGVVSAGQLMADDAFTGETADAYRNAVVPGQREAMEALVSNWIIPLASLLDDTADAIDDYTFSQLHALFAVLAAIIALAVGAAASETGIGLIAAIVAAALALADAVYQIAISEHNLGKATDNARGDIESILNNHIGLENGHWPQGAFPA